MEQDSLEVGDLEQAEIINDNITDLREKAILVKSLTIIEENDKQVILTSSMNSGNCMIKKFRSSMTAGNTPYSNYRKQAKK
jgi:hypothetical protein